MKSTKQKITVNEEKEPQCRVTTFKRNERKKEVVPESKIGRYKPKNYHLTVDLVHMTIYLKKNGKPRSIPANKTGIQGRPLELLTKLARRAGVFMSPYDLGNMSPYVESHFIAGNIQQYCRKLRLNLFEEDGSNPRYILTSNSPYKVALNSRLSVCLIEPGTNGMQEE
jgi:hypothetical protein